MQVLLKLDLMSIIKPPNQFQIYIKKISMKFTMILTEMTKLKK